MPLSLQKPTPDDILRLRSIQERLRFSYEPSGITKAGVGASNATAYVVDHTHCELGRGEACFRAAVSALQNWQQFALGWLEASPTSTPIQTGEVVSVIACVGGIWSTNFARIVYTIDEQQGPIRRFGFAYGTLPDHMEAGEERFLIEWDTDDDIVRYDIVAYSRPRHLLAKIGYPFVRRMQKRFGRESAATMQSIAGVGGRS
jgi:uncharacterized protein (UPF0548 family)